MTRNTDFDVVIAGSGPAGTTTAITLARAGRRVLVLEKRQVARFNVGETIAPSAKSLVEVFLGPLGPKLPEWALPSLGNISIWSAPQPQTQDYFFNAYGPGLCVNRDGFDEALRQAAQAHGAHLQRGTTITGVSRDAATWRVTLATPHGPSHITCAYLVDATGRAAQIGKLLRLPRHRPDPLTAYALRFASHRSSDPDGFLRIEACSYGWWYSNRVPTRAGEPLQRVAVLHTDPDLPEARRAAQRDGLLSLLTKTQLIGPFLHAQGYQPTGRLRGAPAGHARSTATHPGYLAVGDAAHSYDPLSSQGLQQALTSGGKAGQALSYALANPDDPAPFLARYAQQMQETATRYHKDYHDIYTMERRWTDHPFWRARQDPSTFSQPLTARDTL